MIASSFLILIKKLTKRNLFFSFSGNIYFTTFRLFKRKHYQVNNYYLKYKVLQLILKKSYNKKIKIKCIKIKLTNSSSYIVGCKIMWKRRQYFQKNIYFHQFLT